MALHVYLCPKGIVCPSRPAPLQIYIRADSEGGWWCMWQTDLCLQLSCVSQSILKPLVGSLIVEFSGFLWHQSKVNQSTHGCKNCTFLNKWVDLTAFPDFSNLPTSPRYRHTLCLPWRCLSHNLCPWQMLLLWMFAETPSSKNRSWAFLVVH